MAKEAMSEKEGKALAVQESRPIASRLSEMERLFERMVDDIWGGRFPGMAGIFGKERLGLPTLSLRMPSLDLYEEKDEIVVKADIPGMSKEDIQVSMSGDMLTIKGEKKQAEEVKEKDYYRRERSYGSFARSVQLPCEVKGDAVKASFKDGVLEIRCQKTDEAKRKSVTIKID
ncbi:MAG: Hsp20/alpha crystallin family protein [Nitrospiraceae bacterium]|nr:Hsp20/alpha crystallin family protein [Nitrospiraceae bacterium]